MSPAYCKDPVCLEPTVLDGLGGGGWREPESLLLSTETTDRTQGLWLQRRIGITCPIPACHELGLPIRTRQLLPSWSVDGSAGQVGCSSQHPAPIAQRLQRGGFYSGKTNSEPRSLGSQPNSHTVPSVTIGEHPDLALLSVWGSTPTLLLCQHGEHPDLAPL